MTGRTSSSRAGNSGLAALTAGLLICGCEDAAPPDPAPVVWEGEHLEFATNGEAAPQCGGTLPFLDAFVGMAASEMGLNPKAPVRYYLL